MKKAIKIIIPIIVAVILLRLCGHFIITNQDKLGFYDIPESTTAGTTTQNNQYETLLNNDSEFLNCIIERFANENNYTCLLKDKSTNYEICLYNLFCDEYDGILNCYASARRLLLNLKQTKYWNDISEFQLNFSNTDKKLKFKMKVKKDDLDEFILNLDDVADMSAVS